MKELTREELPDDGTKFVVTWTYNERDQWAEVGRQIKGQTELFCNIKDKFEQYDLGVLPRVRYWQFPERETV